MQLHPAADLETTRTDLVAIDQLATPWRPTSSVSLQATATAPLSRTFSPSSRSSRRNGRRQPGQRQDHRLHRTLAGMSRAEAKARVESWAQKCRPVSAKTDFLVAGADAGSKARKAAELGVTVLDEASWLALIEG